MKHTSIPAIIAALFVISGCTTFKPYAQNPFNPTAKIPSTPPLKTPAKFLIRQHSELEVWPYLPPAALFQANFLMARGNYCSTATGIRKVKTFKHSR